jgi:hypothetical protein
MCREIEKFNSEMIKKLSNEVNLYLDVFSILMLSCIFGKVMEFLL